ncbi:MAG: nucleoside-triphosphatase [Lachnospiraceae bacterium]
MVNKFIIIGNSNTGKSAVLDKILEDTGYRPIGFRMKDFQIENEFRGYYIHSILEVEGFHNNLPIQTSLLKRKKRIQLSEVYDTFGVQCLKDVLSKDKDEYDCIVLDELGRGEYTSKEFSKYVNKILDSDNKVFILMKNTPNEVTTEIRKRRDILIYDLDNMSQDEVILNIEDKLK